MRKAVQAPRDHPVRLWESSLRVSESLDVNAVLKEVVENARVLAGARYGVITFDDNASRIEEVVSSGFSEEGHRRLLEFPGRRELNRYLRDLAGPLTLRDLPDRIGKLGIPGDLPRECGPHTTLLAVPMRYRDVHVGNFFLSEKEVGKEFTEEDQEVLLLFASHAATAIANARRHRDERRARASLEALVDAAPVGLVVFDARSADVLSANREAWRIVGDLHTPGCSLEQLFQVLTVWRGDGREIPLDRVSLARELQTARPVRGEEVLIEAPDGQCVPTLVSATPVRSVDSEAELVVVTLQDMTPMQEQERMRTELLGIVGHELRAPLLSVKGCTAAVLDSRAIPDPAELRHLFRIIDDQVESMRSVIGDLLDASRIEAGSLSVEPAARSVEALVDQARNSFLAADGKNPLRIDIPPDMPNVQADRRRILQVLGNLLANASRHSPEWAPIRIAAVKCGPYVAISVTDEGVGVPAETLPLLFRKFFRSDGLGGGGETRGAGLGLAICKGLVEAHGGRIRAESGGPGQGARFTFTLPVAEEAAPRPAQ